MRFAVITRRQARTVYLKSNYSFDPKKTLLKENETDSNYSTNIQLIFSLFPVMTIKVKHKSPHQREIIYLSLHCHDQNDSCIKVGSDESHFNVSAETDGQSHKTVSTDHYLFKEKRRAEAVSNRGPSAYQPNASPLGQTGSPSSSTSIPSSPPPSPRS